MTRVSILFVSSVQCRLVRDFRVTQGLELAQANCILISAKKGHVAPLIFHWPKQVAQPPPTSRGRKRSPPVVRRTREPT